MHHRVVRRARTRRSHAGFTLVELMIALVLFTIVGAGLLRVLSGQQRFYRGTSEIIGARTQLRDAAAFLPADLRAVSTSDTLVNSSATRLMADIYAWSDSAVEFRGIIGSSVVCVIPVGRGNQLVLPPADTLSTGAVYTAWLSQPQVGDSILLYDDGMYLGSKDDRWRAHRIDDISLSTTTNVCPPTTNYTGLGDATKPSVLLTISPAAHSALPGLDSTVIPGAPIRFFRRAGYAMYPESDGQWYLASYDCLDTRTPACTTPEAVAGPYTGSTGFRLTYRDSTEALLDPAAAQPRSIARIDITAAVISASRLSGPGRLNDFYRDTLRTSVGIRNRN